MSEPPRTTRFSDRLFEWGRRADAYFLWNESRARHMHTIKVIEVDPSGARSDKSSANPSVDWSMLPAAILPACRRGQSVLPAAIQPACRRGPSVLPAAILPAPPLHPSPCTKSFQLFYQQAEEDRSSKRPPAYPTKFA